MSDRECSEEEVVAVLERAGPLQDEDLMALAQELGLDLTHPARRAHFRKTMQWSTIQFALDTLRQACEPRDHARDLLEYLAAHPDQLPAFLRGELGASPRFQDNIAVPGIRRHLLTDGPPRDDPAFMVIWVDWMRARIRQIHSEIPRRRGKPKINAPLQVFIEHLARVALAFGKEVTRPTHAGLPETKPFFRFVDKALFFGCLAARRAFQQVGGISSTSRAKAIEDLDRMRALKSRGLVDVMRKGLDRLPQTRRSQGG